MNSIAAKTAFRGIRANGEELDIHLEIGMPYLRGKHGPEDWACPISLTPLYSKLADQVGIDPFQSLCLASSLALDLLQGFIDDGGRIMCSDGTDVPLEAYALGIARKADGDAA